MDITPTADFEAGRITRTVRVAASQRETWAALTDPAAIEQWWGHPAVFPDGVREGAEGTFEWVGHGLMPMRVERFDEPSRGRRLPSSPEVVARRRCVEVRAGGHLGGENGAPALWGLVTERCRPAS